MKKILLVVVIIIFITLLLPLAIVWLIGGSGEGQSPIESGTVSVYVSEEDCVKDMDINEYLKCVVAAEMPADFEEEALKADFELAEELASHGVGLKHDVWNVVPNSIFFKQTTPSLDYYVKLTKGFYEIMQKYGINTEMDNYRKCSMHASINLDRI